MLFSLNLRTYQYYLLFTCISNQLIEIEANKAKTKQNKSEGERNLIVGVLFGLQLVVKLEGSLCVIFFLLLERLFKVSALPCLILLYLRRMEFGGKL